MKTKLPLVLIFFFLTVGTSTRAQSPDSIEVGGTTLKLGMAQGGVLQQLGESYDLLENGTSTASSSSWMVAAKNQHKTVYASLNFKDGRLANIMKYWDIDTPDTAAGFASVLFGAISSFERAGNTNCRIQTGQIQNPGNEIKTVFINCRLKYLRLDIYSPLGQQGSATVTEVLEIPANR